MLKLFPGSAALVACTLLATCAGIGKAVAQTSQTKVQKPPPCAADDPVLKPKAVGASPATSTRWPWLVALRLRNQATKTSMAVCGGSMIAPNWALTAAHCVHDVTAGSHTAAFWKPDGTKLIGLLEAIVGVDDLRRAGAANTYSVESIVIHETYATAYKAYRHEYARWKQGLRHTEPTSNALTSGHDIALVKIAGSWGGALSTMSGQPGTDPESDGSLQVAGFGLVEVDRQRDTMRRYAVADQTLYAGCARLMEVTLPVVDAAACHTRFKTGTFKPSIGSQQICAGFQKPAQQDACSGDSGGPLTARDRNGAPYQVGIVSWGMEDCGGYDTKEAPYGVYTRVSQFADWIKLKTGLELQWQPVETALKPNDPQHTKYLTAALRDIDAAIGGTKGKVRLTLEGADPANGTKLKLAQTYKLRLSSPIAGRLLIVDIDAAGNVTQIFPNKFTTANEKRRISPGVPAVLPASGWEFDDFQAQEPTGHGKIVALVVPDGFPDVTVGEEEREQAARGLVPVRRRTSYLMNLLQQISSYSARTRSLGRPVEAEWAYDIVDYSIEP